MNKIFEINSMLKKLNKEDMEIIYTLEEESTFNNSIYLAGPTYRPDENGNQKSGWREEAINILKELNFNGVLFVPECRNGKSLKDWSYSRQVKWEMDKMGNCNVILFWIPRDMKELPALTTNTEFGEYLYSGKIVIGAPKDSENNRYLEERCKIEDIKWHNNLKNTIEETLNNLT